jgi:fermentation-respiration switch protein FrsA (DUF1100 family)
LSRVGTLSSLALVAAGAYVGVALLVWAFQERLLFYPQPVRGPATPPAGWTAERVSIPTPDGPRLAGVLVKPPSERPAVVLYFGGNAEEVTAYAPDAATTYGDRAVLLLNYRGYGESQGAPGERELVADGVVAFDWLRARSDVDGSRIALHGRSLGAGVAVQVAALRPPRCVILTTPFDSALDVARRVYPWLPVSWLMRHPFDSLAHAPKLDLPALLLVGEADTLIPPAHARRLAAAWGRAATLVPFPGMGHNDISFHPRYDAEIHAFLEAHH